MAHSRARKNASTRRKLLARPLDALLFLLPLLIFYEWVCFQSHDRVIAFVMLRRFLELFGHVGVWVPGLVVVAVLLAMQIASRQPWELRWRRAAGMYIEAIALALPILGMNWLRIRWLTLAPSLTAEATSTTTTVSPILQDLALSVGAGIYEELVFRLAFISLAIIIGVDLLGFRRGAVAVVAIVASSLMFSAHHHYPIGAEPFELTRFAFRAAAGAYLAIVFWVRGYGAAAGCHAAYNVMLVVSGVYGQ